MLNFVIDVCGWAAMLLIIGAYFLVTVGRLTPQNRVYQWMNIIGALGFIVNSSWYHAFPSAALNIVWAAIALYSLLRPVAARTD